MTTRARSIVLAYDGSESSRRALDAAADLVGYGSTLTVVGLGAPPVLVDAREQLLRRNVPARYLGPTDRLGEAARDHAADLVVVGRRPVFVAVDDVLADAGCDVLVVS